MKSVVALLIFLAVTAWAQDYDRARAGMVSEIEAYAVRARGADAKLEPAVLEALGSVERHHFVPPEQQRSAYENRPLPIGHGQTISQPYIVALMTNLIAPQADDIVLEVGTGSGYQAAILAKIVQHVYSIEIIRALADDATTRVRRLGYGNVTTRLGDGYHGWEEHGPYDAIVVTAAASHVPPPLLAQLKPGGRMVIPVGGRFMTQQLLLIEKTAENELITRQVAAVRFVPLTGEH